MIAIKKIAVRSVLACLDAKQKIDVQPKLKKKVLLLVFKIRSLRGMETRDAIYQTLLLMSQLESLKLGRQHAKIKRRLVRSLHFLMQRVELKDFDFFDKLYHRLENEIDFMKRTRRKDRWSKETMTFMVDALQIMYLRISTLVINHREDLVHEGLVCPWCFGHASIEDLIGSWKCLSNWLHQKYRLRLPVSCIQV